MKRAAARFGFSDTEWDEAVAEVREAILTAARDFQMTWYGQVAERVQVIHLEPFSAPVNHLLGEILEQEHAAGRPLLTAIVTHKHGDKEPGDGFYEMARSLGYRFEAPYLFWATQVQDVFKAYGRGARGRRSQVPRT